MKRERLTPPEFFFFWRPSEEEHGWMSNWSFHSIKDGGLLFPTVEHFLMYYKAMEMGDQETAVKILQAKTPKEAKTLGRHVKNYEDARWNAIRFGIMVQGLKLKISQRPRFQDALRAMEGKIIAETSPYDRIWGIGFSKDDPRALDESLWGTNLLGKAWMKVRDEL